MSINWGAVITAEVKVAEALEAAKIAARAQLAAQITVAREALITTLPGQTMIYLAKEAEAARWMAEAGQDLSGFPLLSAEIGITAPDPDTLAQIWLNMADLWRGAAAQLEALRLTVGAGIDAATTPAEVQVAMMVLAL